MVFDFFFNYHILRYIIYEFLTKFSGGPWPTCLVKILCEVFHRNMGIGPASCLAQAPLYTVYGSKATVLKQTFSSFKGITFNVTVCAKLANK